MAARCVESRISVKHTYTQRVSIHAFWLLWSGSAALTTCPFARARLALPDRNALPCPGIFICLPEICAMSIKLMTKVWENGPEDRTEAMVLLALADRANDDGSSCFPSIAEVSQRSRLSRRGTQKVIRRLDDKGYLTVHENEGRGGTNNYKLHPERLGGRTEFAGGGEHDSPGGEPDDGKGRSTFARNRQEPPNNRQGDAPAHEDPVDVLVDLWDVRPTAYQKDRIRQVVDDVDEWLELLDRFKMQNKDSKKAIGWAVEDYQDRPTGDGAPASKYAPSPDPDL